MTPFAALSFSVGSLAGGFARWALAGAVSARAGDALPWGILAVNLIGCLLAGLLDGLGARLSPGARLTLVSGLCGAFTTFSALMLDASRLPAGRALAYVAGSAAAGLLCVRLGAALAGRL